MSGVTNISFLSILIALVIVLAWIAIYYKDKYLETQDELFDLADKKDFFEKKPSIMRHDERTLFDILVKLYGEKYFVFPQVRLSDILTVKEEIKDHDNLYREIDHRSLDFVLFDKNNISPVLAIELNGPSHFQANRKNRDQKISNILSKSGIQLLALAVQDKYSESDLLKKIDPLLVQTS